MSLITGREWERAVWAYLQSAKIEGVTCSRSPATAEHTGGRARFTGAGPADYQVAVGKRRVALEVKAWTNGSRRFPLVRIEPSQAADMDAADLGVVLLRWAGSGPHGPDLVYLLPWATLGPLWWTAHRGEAARGAASLTEGDCRRLAVDGFGVDGVRLVMDEHGAYRCPAVLPALVEGLE